MVRRRLAAALVGAASLTAGCGDAGPPPGDRHALDGEHVLAFEADAHRVVPGTALELSFDDGSVSAYAGCNHLEATYGIDHGRLELRDAMPTLAACSADLDAQDQWFFGWLEDGPRLESRLVEDDYVVQGAGIGVRFKSDVYARTLERLSLADWDLVGVEPRGEDGTALPRRAKAQRSFAMNGSVMAGTMGCATFRVDASEGDDVLRMGRLRRSRGACEHPPDQFERAVANVLHGKVRARFTGTGSVVLSNDWGALQYAAR